MKSKPVSHQSALAFFCWMALSFLSSHFTQAQVNPGQPAPNAGKAAAPQQQQLPPALVTILNNWEKESGKINKLEGEHVRIWYDDVFCVEKRSEGRFYYEKPDKGRIDITPMKVDAGAPGGKINPKTGKPFALQPGENERWICDGKRIFKIDEDDKIYEVYPLPLNRRGANIMEGPLPFLFGMPAATAQQRYFMKLLENTPQRIVIAVKPRRRSDAANYSEAKVMLDPKTYFPAAVQLIHPGGNQSTVYSFKKVEANKNRGIIAGFFGKDPFRPDLDDYQLQGKVVAEAGEDQAQQPDPRQQPGPVRQAAFKIPNMVGHNYQAAQKMLQQMGLKSELHRGAPAGEPKLIYQVYQQLPEAGTPAEKGATVHLRLYDNPQSGKN